MRACVDFNVLRPLCSQLRTDEHDRQTSDKQTGVRRASSLNAPYHRSGVITSDIIDVMSFTDAVHLTK